MEEGLTRIFLGGKLGQLFGKEWKLYVKSPAEALRAININTGGKLKEYLRLQKRDTYYKCAINNKHNLLTAEEIKRPTGNCDIFIFPSAKGGSNVVRIIIGIILIIVGIVVFAYGGDGSIFIQYGIGLIIGGVVGLIIGTPSFTQNPSSEATGGSALFSNNAMTFGQGGPVRVAYGRVLLEALPVPISLAYSNFDQNPNYAPDGGIFTGLPDFPGGYYYPYEIVDPTDGFPFYTQSTTPVPAMPPSYH